MINSIANTAPVSSAIFNPSLIKESSKTSTVNLDNAQRDQSNIIPLRDRRIGMIDRFANTEEAAKQLLSTFSRPSTSGIVMAGLPDLTNPDAIARLNRISEKFDVQQQAFEQQKTSLINDGLAAGKSSKTILHDIIDLYDAQPELFKIGVGWNGQVFAFNGDEGAAEGFQRTLEYSRDVVNTHA